MSVNLSLSSMFKYCFGNEALDKGQSLVPNPPDRITGNTILFAFNLSSVFAKLVQIITVKKKSQKTEMKFKRNL